LPKIITAAEHGLITLWQPAGRFIKFQIFSLVASFLFGLFIMALQYYFAGLRGKDLIFYLMAGIVIGEFISAVMTLITIWRLSKVTALVSALTSFAVAYLLINFGAEALIKSLRALSINI
jgi:hypothetical protein